MWDGKKEVAENIVYGALAKLKKIAKDQNELTAFLEVVDALKPAVEVKGGVVATIPVVQRSSTDFGIALVGWIFAQASV